MPKMPKKFSCGLCLATLFAMFTSCTNTKHSSQGLAAKPFSILEGSFQNISGGRPGSPTETNYRFIALINTDTLLQFDELWVREKGITLPLTPGRWKGPATNQPFHFLKGDTIALYASTSQVKQPEKTNAPAELDGAAVILYRLGGKKTYQAIPALTEKQTDPLPKH